MSVPAIGGLLVIAIYVGVIVLIIVKSAKAKEIKK